MPKFSIILPVRNGSNHVYECINSILSQNYKDFELIVLENCSTDNTLAIIYSFNDPRIKVYTAEKPLEMEENWHRAVTISKQEFMTLIGHDDLLDKDYLSIMNDLIKKHSGASLYQAHFRYIDTKGREIGKCAPMYETIQPHELIHNFFNNKIDLMGTGFMMRSSDYDSVGGIPMYPGLLFADMQLFIELGKKSYLAVANEECFSYRKHSASTTSSSSDKKFVDSFGYLINYLSELKKRAPELEKIILHNSTELLRQYCQAITHRTLRTPRKKQSYSVSDIINKFREYGEKLGNNSFEPLNFKMIRIGKVIDNNFLFHSLFLAFKKLVRKPLVKA